MPLPFNFLENFLPLRMDVLGHKMFITLLLQLLSETFFYLGTGTLEMYIEMHVGLHVKCLLDLSHCKQN